MFCFWHTACKEMGMKHLQSAKSFMEQLLAHIQLPRELGPDDIHVVNVHARYGTYQIIIGPAHQKNRPIDINGELHHLYIYPNRVRTMPTAQQTRDHLKGCIILRNLVLHLKDPNGDGKHLDPKKIRHCIFCKDSINLSGDEKPMWMKEMEETGKLALSTYHIVQEDILRSFSQPKNS